MLHTFGFAAIGGFPGGDGFPKDRNEVGAGSFGGGGFVVGGAGVGFTVGFTGTIGFSVSVFGTGGQTRFSNLTVEWLPCKLELSCTSCFGC